MFIYCIDDDLKTDMIVKGFKVIRVDANGTLFAADKKLKFDFSKVDKNKFLFTNKLIF